MDEQLESQDVPGLPGARVCVGMDRLVYFNADRTLLISLPEHAPTDPVYWSQVRACIDDAQMRSLRAGGGR